MVALLPPPPTSKRCNADELKITGVEISEENKIYPKSSKICNERKTIDRLRSRLARHLHDICTDKDDTREKIRILKRLGENEPLAAWHRRRIIGQIQKRYALITENRLRYLIRQLIIDLSESLGGAA